MTVVSIYIHHLHPMRFFLHHEYSIDTFYSDEKVHYQRFVSAEYSHIWKSRSGLMRLFVPQVETWELGWHGWIFLWWTAPMFGVCLDGQWFPSRPTSLPGKHHLHYRLCFPCICRDNLTVCLLSLQEGSPPLSWQQRCLIAEGSARGLEYLHSNHHVHRDVKRY